MRRLVAVGLTWMALAAGCRDVVTDHVPFTLDLPEAPECRAPTGLVTLTALGDFPTTDARVAQLDPREAPAAITRFDGSTVAFSASTTASSGAWSAFGWASRASLGADPTLMLRPLGLSCPLADPEARLPIGGSAVAIDASQVMLIGGLDDVGAATRRVAILHAREETVVLPSYQRAAQIAFAAASLTPDARAVLVTGGAARADGDARDSWERLPIEGGMATAGLLVQRRRDHASITVDAGAVHGVLLVGGNDGTAPVSSIEWIDADAEAGDVLRATLLEPRDAPLLFALDATHVAIAGGTIDPDGTLAGDAEVLDLAADTITAAPSPRCEGTAPTDARDDWVTALPSGRLAWAQTCEDTSPGTTRTTLYVIDLREGTLDAATAIPTVLDPIASALASGRVLVEGHRSDGTRLAFVVDPGVATRVAASTSRLPRSLVSLADGTIVELAATAASIRRDEGGAPFDSPPPSYLFAVDQARLALDVASHFRVDASSLALASGVDRARIDVPALRFARFSATLDAEGPVDVIVTGTHLETLATVASGGAGVTLGACTFARAADDGALVVSRGDDGAIVARTERGAGTCRLAIDVERVGVGVVAHAGASLRSLALARLP